MKKIIAFSIVIFCINLLNGQSYKQHILEQDEILYLSNELIIKLKTEPVQASSGEALLPHEFQKAIEFLQPDNSKRIFSMNTGEDINGLNRIVSLKYKSPIDPMLAAAKLKNNPFVEWIEPRFVYQTTHIPDDPYYTNQWSLVKIKAADAWEISKGDTSVIIGIVDTGVDWDHPDIAANLWVNWNEIPDNGIDDDGNGFVDDFLGWDFGGLDGTPDNNPIEDRPEHGTHVAGIASAVSDNGIGVASIGYNCKVMAIKACRDDYRSPTNTAYIIYGYEGIVYAANNGAKIINCSWGGTGYSIFGQETIDYATSLGALVVAAAGNSNTINEHFPSGYKNVLSVAATDEGDMKSSYSNYGYSIDVSAPGNSIYSTWQNDTYLYASGTSMASPLTAGLAGLVKSKFPGYNPLQVAEQIRSTADNINSMNPSFTNLLGKGRINAKRALEETNSISVRSISAVFSDSTGGDADGIIEPGEIINVYLKFFNYLNPTSNLNVYFESKTSYATVNYSVFNAGAVPSLTEFDNSSNKFSFTVAANTPQNTKLEFNLIFIDGSYNDIQWVNIIANPTYATVAGNEIAMTITSKGSFGFNDYPNNFQGDGFKFSEGSNLLFEGALIVGTAADKIVNSARGLSSNYQDQDFVTEIPFTVKVPGTFADVEGTTVFNDNASANSIGLRIKLNAYSFSSLENEKSIILRYRLMNTTAGLISSLYTGLFFDWDIVDGSGIDDITNYDQENNFGYAYHFGGNPDTYTGTALISHNYHGFWAINNSGGDGGFSIYDGFSKAEKWQAISSGLGKLQAGAGDISHVVSGGPFSINPGEFIDIGFVVAAAENLDSLRSAIQNARAIYPSIPTSIENEIDFIAGDFELHQNYPNPFNPVTSIKYKVSQTAIGEKGSVKLIVFDMLGRKVATLVNEMKIPGEYEVSFDASGLSSGIYFYRLQAGSFFETRKMILLR
jgi:hypothetical protein